MLKGQGQALGPFSTYMSDEEASKATGYSLDRPITRYYEWADGHKTPVYGESDLQEATSMHANHWHPLKGSGVKKPYLAGRYGEDAWRGQFIESLAKCEACRKEMEK